MRRHATRHVSLFFFFNDTATTEIYTLSLHDALPISRREGPRAVRRHALHQSGVGSGARLLLHGERRAQRRGGGDRKSTRLNSSHGYISYAVFCLKKKKKYISDYYIIDDKHISVSLLS